MTATPCTCNAPVLPPDADHDDYWHEHAADCDVMTLTCTQRDMAEVERLLALLAPDMAAHPEEYTLEALRKRWPSGVEG